MKLITITKDGKIHFVFIFLSFCVILEAKMEGYQDEGYLFNKLFC